MTLQLKFSLLFFFFCSFGVFAQSPGGAELNELFDVDSSNAVRVLTSGVASDSCSSSLSLDLGVCPGVARYSNLGPTRVKLYTTLRMSSGSAFVDGGVLLSTTTYPCISDPTSILLSCSLRGVLDTLVDGLSSETVYYYRSFVRSLFAGDTVTSYGLSGSFVTPSPCGFRQIYAAGFCWMDRNLGDDELISSPVSYWASNDNSFLASIPSSPAAPSSSDSYGTYHNFNTRLTHPTAGSGSGNWTTANDPCPDGFKVPTRAQLNSLVNSGYKWASGYGCFDSNALCLPAAGYRGSSGSFNRVGTYGYYWSSEEFNSSNGYYLNFDSGNAITYYNSKSEGRSVRCVAK